jgi:DNA-directed RNA polymerase subunit M/transcription elongation factor TFIIS
MGIMCAYCGSLLLRRVYGKTNFDKVFVNLWCLDCGKTTHIKRREYETAKKESEEETHDSKV